MYVQCAQQTHGQEEEGMYVCTWWIHDKEKIELIHSLSLFSIWNCEHTHTRAHIHFHSFSPPLSINSWYPPQQCMAALIIIAFLFLLLTPSWRQSPKKKKKKKKKIMMMLKGRGAEKTSSEDSSSDWTIVFVPCLPLIICCFVSPKSRGTKKLAFFYANWCKTVLY